MKAIILAAGRDMIRESPACLAPIGESSILSKQISLYQNIGIEDITIVIGNDKNCWKKKHREYVRTLGYAVIENSNNHFLGNSLSLKLALEQGVHDFVIISDGDTFFDQITASQLINSKYDNLLLTRVTNILTDTGTKVNLVGNKVVEFNEHITSGNPPWSIYGGIIKINRVLQHSLLDQLKKSANKNIFFTHAISYIINDDSNSIRLFSINSSTNAVTSLPILKGGSYAGTKKITLVHKETTEWTQKLKDEINWLENLPSDLCEYFPKILNKGSSKDTVYYDMPYFAYPSLRRLIFSGAIDAITISNLLMQIIEFMFEKVYTKAQAPADNCYSYKIHIDRIKNRISETSTKSNIFKEIFSYEEITINGIQYQNLMPLIKILEKSQDLIDLLTPSHVSMVHGDLHFDNILINNIHENNPKFVFIDPRGLDKTYNYTYDLGKIWHSFHGLYDIIHEGLFNLELETTKSGIRVNFNYKGYPIINLYREINFAVYKQLKKLEYLKNDPCWELRVFFAEVSHFCSVMPFHLKNDKTEKLAISLYVTGVLLLNKFYDIYINNSDNGKIDSNKFLKDISKTICEPLNIK